MDGYRWAVSWAVVADVQLVEGRKQVTKRPFRHVLVAYQGNVTGNQAGQGGKKAHAGATIADKQWLAGRAESLQTTAHNHGIRSHVFYDDAHRSQSITHVAGIIAVQNALKDAGSLC